MICPNCGCTNDDNAQVCSVCGAELNIGKSKPDFDNSKKKTIIILVAVLIAVCIAAACVIGVTLHNKSNKPNVDYPLASDSTNDVNLYDTGAVDDDLFENIDNDADEEANADANVDVDETISNTQATTLSQKERNRKKALGYIDNANSALKEGNRETAYNYAQMALDLCPDDASVKKKYNYYKQFLPFKLYQSENVIQYDVNSSNMNSVQCFVYFDKSYNSNNNKSMKHALSVEYYDSVVGQLCTINYDLNGKYDKISGNYFLPQSEKNTGLATYFIIYGDGKKIFTSKNVTAGITPKKFDVKVSNVKTLTVEFYGKVNNTDGIGFGSLGINDFVALKNLP